MKKTLKWRLATLPTPSEVKELLDGGLITTEEARDILFSEETQTDRDKKSLESEIKFLRELVEQLSSNRTQIINTIEKVYKPYEKYYWYEPYKFYCNGSVGTTTSSMTTGTSNIKLMNTAYTSSSPDFSSIKTF